MRVRPFVVAVTAAIAGATLPAQFPCYDAQAGTRLALTDDSVAANQQLGFSFTGPGGAATTAITVSSNGFVWLTPNATANDCCNVEAANLVAGAARIAPYWVDLNPGVGGGVYFRAVPAGGGDPARAVVTWLDVPEFGTSNRVTVQLQLLADGRIVFGYEGPIRTDQHVVLSGLSQGNGAAPNPYDLSALFAGGNVDTGGNATIHETFGNDAFDLTGYVLVFTPNGQGGYTVAERPDCRRASLRPFGRGCPSEPVVYEAFAPGQIDLTGRALRFSPLGATGYTVTAENLPLLPVQNVIAVADDAVVACNLPFAFAHPGGSTSTIDVSTNGIATLVAGAIPHARCCQGDPAEFVAGPAAIAALWQDLDPTGGGAVFWDVEAGQQRAWATWFDCPEFGSSAVRCRAQLVFEAGGAFELRYGTVANALHRCLVGYTPGGAVGDPGSLDFTAQLPFSTGSGGTPLLLRGVGSARPAFGATMPLQVTGVPVGSPLGFLALGLVPLVPAAALASVGMPDCFQYLQVDATRSFVILGSPAMVGVPIPADTSLAGMSVFAQAVVVAPGSNTLGALATDALELRLGR